MSNRLVVVLSWPRGATLYNAVLFSLLLHVGLAVAVVTVPSLRGRPELPLPTMDVVLVSPIANPEPPKPVESPPKAAPVPKPPPPEPEKPPEGPSVTPEDPPDKPVEKPKPKPTPKPEKTLEPRKEPEPPPPSPPRETPQEPFGQADPLADQAPDEPQGPISAGTGAALEGMGAEFDWYRDSVIRALYTSWRQPFASGLREALVVTIAFDINRDGSVSGVRIAEPSGNSALDRSAYRAVLEAQLPPLPRNNGRNSQPAAFVFQLDPQTR